MIVDYFKKNLISPKEYTLNNIHINIGIKYEKISLLRNKKYKISIVIIIDNEVTYEINNICEFLIKTLLDDNISNKKIFIDANWYIFSNIVNKDIYKKIDKKENIHYKNMYNRFLLINNINGEIIFNPGKIENNVISDRMKFVFNYYNTEYPMDKEKDNNFSKELMHIYEILEMVLNDSK